MKVRPQGDKFVVDLIKLIPPCAASLAVKAGRLNKWTVTVTDQCGNSLEGNGVP